MNRYAITLGAATVLAGTLLASAADAATINRSTYTQASGACQGSLPSFEGNFRKRPLAVANEGTTSAYLTCGVRNDENGAVVNTVKLDVTNRAATDIDVNCTLVDGFIDAASGFANYYPQTVTATAGVDSAFSWDGPFTYASISCAVPAKIEANIVYTSIDDEIGT